MLLHELPKEHPLRNQPVGGMFHRWECWQGDPVIAHEEEYWSVSAWKRIPPVGEAYVDMPISKHSYNELEELGGFWTKGSEWTDDKTLHPKPKRSLQS